MSHPTVRWFFNVPDEHTLRRENGDRPQNWSPRVPPFKVIQRHRKWHRSTRCIYDFPFVIYSNCKHISYTVSEINGDTGRKKRNFIISPLSYAYRRTFVNVWAQKRLTIYTTVSTPYHSWTDGQTYGQIKSHVNIASQYADARKLILGSLTIPHCSPSSHLSLAVMNIQHETQLSLTNRCDSFIGHSRSPSIVPFHNVRHSFLLCNSNFVFKTRRFYDIRLQKCRERSMVPIYRFGVVSY